MAITDWPEDQRPRERLIKHGPQKLSDAELLAVFLRIGVTAGASAPEVLVQAVIDRLKELGAKSVRHLEGVKEHVIFPMPKGLGGV